MSFARGFKTRCENIAQSIRADLEPLPSVPLSVDTLANCLGGQIITPHDVPEMSGEALRVLLEGDADDWSAFTISGDGAALLIHNPTPSFGRRSSSIAHELCHLGNRSPSGSKFDWPSRERPAHRRIDIWILATRAANRFPSFPAKNNDLFDANSSTTIFTLNVPGVIVDILRFVRNHSFLDSLTLDRPS